MAAAKPRSRRTAQPRATSKARAKSAARTSSRKVRRASSKRAPATRSASARSTAQRSAPKRTTAKRPAKRAAPKRPAPKRVAPKRPAPKRAASKRPAPKRPAQTPLAAAPAFPNAIGFMTQHLDFTSHDLEGVRRFYTELLGFSQYDHNPELDYLSVSIAPNVTIGFMPPMPGPPEQWRPPREPALYFVVENVDQACAALAEKGVALDQPPADMPWGDRAALLRDPEGRMVWIAQHLQKG